MSFFRRSLEDFKILMSAVDQFLNSDVEGKEEYYLKRGGIALEQDVYAALVVCSRGTSFEDTVELVSGASFPDIVVGGCFGVEVKSTKSNHWSSTGSSILESTRHEGVEYIYLTFGKLASPVQFISRPYDECLTGIAVTHYPRYMINMQTPAGETIFDKMGIPYEELRKMDNPVVPVSAYYKSQLKPNESLWWAGNDPDTVSATPTIRLWSSLDKEEKDQLRIMGFVLFPEVLDKRSNSKYDRFSLWMVSYKSVVCKSIRDIFSSGGQVEITMSDNCKLKMPAAFGRIGKYADLITNCLEECSEDVLREYWQVEDIEDNRLRQWCDIIATIISEASPDVSFGAVWEMLTGFFPHLKGLMEENPSGF